MNHDKIHAFTSITTNYLPKARVLAASVKRLAPEMGFHLMLSDNPPPGFDLAEEPFDSVITLEDLDIPELRQWVFGHSVVELCTAVKGFAFQHLFDRIGAQKAFYFDPDMVVFSRLDELCSRLDRCAILLTPHQTAPEKTFESIIDNEFSSLKHGVFNLGFLGARADGQGRAFIDWWAARLHDFCHDNTDRGLFTDQRWVDLAPCFFDDLEIMRDAGFNVATWNFTHRRVSGNLASGIRVNDEDLGFYHFSGFDSGAQEAMLNKYGADNPALFELRNWYLSECDRAGQQELGKWPGQYTNFDDGTPISRAQRVLYREREDLRKAFPDPFCTMPEHNCYRDWYAANAAEPSVSGVVTVKPDVAFSVALQDFLAYTERRLATARRLGGWRKAVASVILRVGTGLARRILA
ncbi:glycosyl transferase [Thauera chlorobenzoica]|uniref:glycosyl transferase n=1 Tax=Thauera chlorobenzoica TaxID=96773 RepID=UPI00089FB08E|nr:glycosyl transferase [Thauera chlorobenzoica]SEF66807.1 hypothetical protein SAMN05216242_103217 [Thauera chlorobenzoica]